MSGKMRSRNTKLMLKLKKPSATKISSKMVLKGMFFMTMLLKVNSQQVMSDHKEKLYYKFIIS